jgi:hypothetical protein
MQQMPISREADSLMLKNRTARFWYTPGVMVSCTNCGATLPPDAAFCPRCGHAVATATRVAATPARVAPTPAPPPASPPRVAVPASTPPSQHVPAAARHRAPWWLVPAVIVGIIAIAWLVLAGLPFGGDRERDIATVPETETIAEGSTTRDPGTVLDLPPQGMEDEPGTTTTIAPTTTTVAPTPVATTTITPPAQTQPPTTTMAPPPVQVAPPPAAPPPSRTITEAEAAAELRGYVTSRNYYGVASECVRLNARGYRNEGYAFEIWHSCTGGGSSRLLGRWRVDARTREVFRQREDGRYLRP